MTENKIKSFIKNLLNGISIFDPKIGKIATYMEKHKDIKNFSFEIIYGLSSRRWIYKSTYDRDELLVKICEQIRYLKKAKYSVHSLEIIPKVESLFINLEAKE